MPENDETFRYVLLGSGSPPPNPERAGPAEVVSVGSETLLFDCGRNCTTQLARAGIPAGLVDRLFLTHHHYDHMVEFANLVLWHWSRPASVHGKAPLQIYGPPDTSELAHLEIFGVHRKDLESRLALPHPNEIAPMDLRVTDVVEDGLVCEGPGGWTIRAAFLNHARPVIDSLAFRVDFNGRSIVLAGDTAPNDALVRLATGADVLTVESGQSSDDLERIPEWKTWHTAPEDVGRMAAEARVKRVVLKHLSMKDGRAVADHASRVQKHFHGQVFPGQDLMTLNI